MDAEPINTEWLESIGFSIGRMSATKLIPPWGKDAAIVEIYVEPVEFPDLGLPHGGAWYVSLCQGVPDDSNKIDDHVLLTHKYYTNQAELLELLQVLGAV